MELFFNAPFAAAVASWLLAQIIKNLMYLFRYKKLSFERFWGAGGMPSSHSAAVCALAAAAGKAEGFNSAVFSVAAILALVVMYDASGVRRAAGMHAREINRIKAIVNKLDKMDSEINNSVASETGEVSKENLEEKMAQLKEFLGHSPLEVCLGAALGVAVGILMPIL